MILIAKEIPIDVIGKLMIKYVNLFLSGHAPRDHRPLKVIYQHWFPLDAITSNDNIESMPTKHMVANLVFSFYILWLQDLKCRIMCFTVELVIKKIMLNIGCILRWAVMIIDAKFVCFEFAATCRRGGLLMWRCKVLHYNRFRI